MPYTKALRARLAALALAAAVLATLARAEVVVRNDGARVEGAVKEQGDFYVVTSKSGSVRIPRAEVKLVLWTSTSCLDSFRADPNVRDLLVLVSRTGQTAARKDLERAVEIVRGSDDVLAAADALIDKWGLHPDRTAEIVRAHVEEFRREYGRRAAVVEARHYVILTNAGAALARETALHMDAIFEEYEKRLLFREKIAVRFVVKVFATEDEYREHDAPHDSVAYFRSATRELVTFADRNRERMFSSLYHEGMHQFLHFYIPDPPAWFDEGLAMYFETAVWRGSATRGGKAYLVGGKLQEAARIVKEGVASGALPPVRKLLTMPAVEFYDVDAAANYAKSWALTHMMIESGDRLLLEMWKDYFVALRDGATHEEANRVFFKGNNIDIIEGMLRKYAGRL